MLRFSSFLSFFSLSLLFWSVFGSNSNSWRNREHIQVHIFLKQSNVHFLEQALLRVSDPSSKEYGNYWSPAKIGNLIGVTNDLESQFEEWFRKWGANFHLADTRDYFVSSFPIDTLSRLSNADIDMLDELSFQKMIPRQLQSHIQLLIVQNPKRKQTESSKILHENTFKYKKLRKIKAGETLGTPNAQKQAYGIPISQKATNETNLQMVWGPGTFGFLKSDLSTFYKQFDVEEDVSLVQHEGFHGTPGGDNFGEGTLDTTYISSMGLGVSTLVSNTNNSQSTEEGQGFGDALLIFASDFSNRKKIPLVLSMSLGSLSWGSIEFLCNKVHEEDDYSFNECLSYLQSLRQVAMYTSTEQVARINIEFMKIGLRGTTLLAASGDGGSHFSFMEFSHLSFLGRALNRVSCKYNFPTFPAASPYVLAVGGIEWNDTPNDPTYWYSGGAGFSWQFPMPNYQKSVVEQYLQENEANIPPSGSFNQSNRAYPDVSALAENVPIIMDGNQFNTGGTSASTPSFAGIISLLNDIRLNKGLPPLGFINPRLYQVAQKYPGEAFYDITEGKTNCGSDDYCCDDGFVGAKGWDAVTGWGSPKWDGLVKYFTSD